MAGTPAACGGAASRAAASAHRQDVAAPGPRRTRRRAAACRAGGDSAHAGVAGQHHLRHRHQQAAIGHVVAGATPPARICARTKSPLRRSAADRPAAAARPRGRRSRAARATGRASRAVSPISTSSSPGASAMPTACAASSSTPRPPIAGVGRIAAAFGLVVEADIAAHDREVERAAGGGHAADGGGELAHDLGLFGIAEIQVVGDGQRPGAGGGEVAPGFGHRLRAARLGVGGAVARRAVGGQRQRAACALDAHDGGVGGAGALARSGRRPCCRTGPRPRRASTDRGSRSACSSASLDADRIGDGRRAAAGPAVSAVGRW